MSSNNLAATLEITRYYTESDLSEPSGVSAARQDIEKLVAQMQAHGIGNTHYYGLMNLQPSLQRIFFIHVPKCGGTSIRRLLVHENQCAPVPVPGIGALLQSTNYMAQACLASNPPISLLQPYMADDASMDLHERFLHIYAGYLLTQNPQKMFILGHKKARGFLPFYRADRDIFFTTVRAPAEILKSMMSYRVYHVLQYPKRPESLDLLKYLNMDIDDFTQNVKSQPQTLAQHILEKDSPSLAAYLSFQERPDYSAIINDLKENLVFIAHMSEQHQMLSALFGEQPDIPHENTSRRRKGHKNTSQQRDGLAAEFTDLAQTDWSTPFVDTESAQVYQRLESSGIIGYWENGGTREGYLELLKNL